MSLEFSHSIHDCYYSAGMRVFSDMNKDGCRVRTTFDLTGRVEGQRNDFSDGCSRSTFRDEHCAYRVLRDRQGISILKFVDGDWLPLKDADESSRVLKLEKQLFSPPQFLS